MRPPMEILLVLKANLGHCICVYGLQEILHP